MTYEEAVTYILNIPKFTRKNSASHTKTLLGLLGNPQEAVKVIHVAGTNGKGSVCAYLDAMLRSERKTNGAYLRLASSCERSTRGIVIDGQMPISDDAICRCI